MNDTTPKRPRPAGRLSQLSKRARLTRRELGQWQPQPPQERRNTTSNFAIPQWTFSP